MDLKLTTVATVENPDVHDLELDSTGDLVWATGETAIAQHLKVRFQFFLGEWFLDLREGIPYYGEVFIKNPSRLTLSSIFRQVILNTPGISGLRAFDLVLDASLRQARLNFEAGLVDGGTLIFSDFIVEVV